MQQALLIRLRPAGPWRYGPGDGGSDRVDTLFRSDRVFSALTVAMRELGFLEEWLSATAQSSSPSVVFSSMFPLQGDTLFLIPPATVWPPASNLVNAPNPVFLSKIRWNAARFIPVPLIDSLLAGQPVLAEQWLTDPDSNCLLRRDRPNSSPFRVATRSGAAVDRMLQRSAATYSAACVEFASGSGLWTVARFASEEAETAWKDRVQAAFRLLCDTGFGGRRSSGWGQAQAPEFQSGHWPGLLFPKVVRRGAASNGAADFWLLSLYSPAADDAVDWGAGDYRLTFRNGINTRALRMVAEGSVLVSHAEPNGVAIDIAADGSAHPVYRSGFALSLRLPPLEPVESAEPVEQPSTEEAIEAQPCEEAEPAPAPPVAEAAEESPEAPSEPAGDESDEF